MNNNFFDLNADTHSHVFSFLNELDAVRLSSTCRFLHNNFPVVQVASKPGMLLDQMIRGSHSEGDQFELVHQELPFPLTSHGRIVCAVLFSCLWHDQKWGNRKGRVAIVAYPKTAEVASNDDDKNDTNNGGTPEIPNRVHRQELGANGGRVVAFTHESAPHFMESLHLTFTPRPNEKYALFLKAGGGGGHTLHLKNIQFKTTFLDKPDRSWSRNYRLLRDFGHCESGLESSPVLMDLLLDLLVATVKSLLQSQTDPSCGDPTLLRCLQEHGFVTTRSSLETLQELLESFIR